MRVAGPVDGGGESQETVVIVGSAAVITGMVNDGREGPEKRNMLNILSPLIFLHI